MIAQIFLSKKNDVGGITTPELNPSQSHSNKNNLIPAQKYTQMNGTKQKT